MSDFNSYGTFSPLDDLTATNSCGETISVTDALKSNSCKFNVPVTHDNEFRKNIRNNAYEETELKDIRKDILAKQAKSTENREKIAKCERAIASLEKIALKKSSGTSLTLQETELDNLKASGKNKTLFS